MFLIGLICLQVFFLLLQVRGKQDLFMSVIHTGQLALVFGQVIVNFMWRAYPGTMEFFESGVAVMGQHLHPWTDVELRRSMFFDDRISVVVNRSMTWMPRVSEELESAIRAHHSAAFESLDPHPLDVRPDADA